MTDGPRQLPTEREILKWNRALPEHLRHCSVVLRFKVPMPCRLTEHFYRVRMTRNMLGSGEDDFWIPEITQPARVGFQICLGCMERMRRVGVISHTCVNPICGLRGRTLAAGPKRGVQSIKTTFTSTHPDYGKPVDITFITGREWLSVHSDEWLSFGSRQLQKKGLMVLPDLLPEVIVNRLRWPRDKIPIELVQGCVAVLDRRYSDVVLCQVWRTCGMLCDQMGWKLK